MPPIVALMAYALVGAPAPTQVVSSSAIEAQVRQELSARLARLGSKAQLRFDAHVPDQRVPMGDVRIESGEISGRWPRPRVGVPVRLWVGRQPIRSLTVWVSFSDERLVPTYAAASVARAPIDTVAVASAQVDMTCCAGRVVEDPALLVGQRLKRSVRAGEPVMFEDFESLPDVAAQQRVSIEVEQGAIRLVTTGVALRDGRIGDRIDVRPDQTQSTVRSRVVAKQKVRVDE